MNGYEAFCKGYRSAYLCFPQYETDAYQQLLTQNLPSLQLNESEVLFFANDQLCQEYIQKSSKLEPESDEHHRLMGEVLNYPPMAVEFFLQPFDDEYKKNKATYEYYDIRFAGHVDDQQVIAEWLWSNVPAPIQPVTVTHHKQSHVIEPIPVAI